MSDKSNISAPTSVMQLPATLVEWSDGTFSVRSELYGEMSVGSVNYVDANNKGLIEKEKSLLYCVLAGFIGWIAYGVVRCFIEKPRQKMRCLEITLLPKK